MRVAVDRWHETDGRAIPVVDPRDPSQVVGFLTREAPFEARIEWARLDQEREQVLAASGPERAVAWLRRRWAR